MQTGGQGEHRLPLLIILEAGFSVKAVMACNGVTETEILIYFSQVDFIGFEELILYQNDLECHAASTPAKYCSTCSHTELALLKFLKRRPNELYYLLLIISHLSPKSHCIANIQQFLFI